MTNIELSVAAFFAAILCFGFAEFVSEEIKSSKKWGSPSHKSCWKCAYRLAPGFERFACSKKMVWSVGIFNGVKYFEMDALRVRDHFCRKFRSHLDGPDRD